MTTYYIAKEGKRTGPFDEAEIRRQVETGALSSNELCWRDGMADWQPIATVLRAHRRDAATGPAPLFLYIPIGRLIALSIVSFSVYEGYWIYRNWRYVKERDNLDIRPFWRGIWGVFHCHSLLRRIHEDEEARSVQIPSFAPNGLATGWVVLIFVSNLISRAPGIGATILAALVPSFLCLVPVQSYVNAVTERRSPGQPYYPWSSGHVVCLVCGIVVWAVLLIGSLVE